MRRSLVSCLALTAAALAGCQSQAPDERADEPPEDRSGACVSAGVSGSSLQLTAPGGFAVAEGSDALELLDEVWFRRNDAGYADLVTLDAFDPDDYGTDKPDSFVLLRALSAASAGDESDSGTPGYQRAVDEVEQEGATEVTYTAPDRVGEGEHSAYGTVETVGDDRYTVTVVAPAGEAFESLRDEVVSSVREGDCG